MVDVGANLGYYSLLAAQLVGPSGRSWHLEPNSENCRLLLSSLRLAGVTNVELLPVAADVSSGWAYYSTHVGSNGGLVNEEDLLSRPGTVVPTFPLDELVTRQVDFLKMDVEAPKDGSSRGPARIIEHDRPIITTELKEEMLRRVSGMTSPNTSGISRTSGTRPRCSRRTAGPRSPTRRWRRSSATGGTATNCATSSCCPSTLLRGAGILGACASG